MIRGRAIRIVPIMEHATASEFCSIFHTNMAGLYQLAYLLTGKQDLAERVFIGALDECLNGNPVFTQRAAAWAKRMIVIHAIRAISPAPAQAVTRELGAQTCNWRPTSENPAEAITGLPSFSRFVFVMVILEKFPIAECDVLLRSKRDDVIQARDEAMLAVSFGSPRQEHDESDHQIFAFADSGPHSAKLIKNSSIPSSHPQVLFSRSQSTHLLFSRNRKAEITVSPEGGHDDSNQCYTRDRAGI